MTTLSKILRALCVFVLLIVMAGFGLCGVFGVVMGLRESSGMGLFFGLIGVGFSIAIGFIIQSISKEGAHSSEPKPPGPSNE